MTRLKYATVQRRESTGDLYLGGGKREKTEKLMTRDTAADEYVMVTMERVDVIDLPEPMTKAEYREWAGEHAPDVLAEYMGDDDE